MIRALFVGTLGLILACGGSSHPVPLGSLPEGTQLLTIVSRGPIKAPYRYDSAGLHPEDWNLPIQGGGTTSGGDQYVVLDDGRRIFCGSSFGEDWITHCWSIQDGVSTPLGPPVLKSKTPAKTLRLPWPVGFAADGSWWSIRDEKLLYAPDLSTMPTEVPLPFEQQANSNLAISTNPPRFAVMKKYDADKLWVINPRGEVLDSVALDRRWITPLWNPQGTAIAFLAKEGVNIWTIGAGRKLVIPLVDGPTGFRERILLLDWSPDGTQLLLNSTRHNPPRYNPCAGIYNDVHSTYRVELATGRWVRLQDISTTTQWVPSSL